MKSEHRGLVAIVLSIVVLSLWYQFFAPTPPPAQPAALQTSDPQAETSAQQAVLPQPAPTSSPAAPLQTAPEAELKNGEEVFLENNLVRITLNTMRGVVTGWELKKFAKNGDKESEVSLTDPAGHSLDVQFNQANFEAPAAIPFALTNKGNTQAELRWKSDGRTLFKRFFLDPDSYQLRLEVEFINNSMGTVTFSPSLDWGKIAGEESPQRGVWFFKTPPDRWHPAYMKDASLEVLEGEMPLSQTVIGKIGWAGAESRYFFGGIIPTGKEGEKLDIIHYQTAGGESLFFTRLFLPPLQILPGERWLQRFDVYGGPKELKRLQAVGANFDKLIGYGWISIVATPILYLLQIFYKVVHNYGIAIILLTILIKILLNPINRKSMESMKKMQVLQPKIKEIREKYANDKQKINMETMQIFKTHKINPAGGCLPMLLQFPIYIALYKVLWNSVELYHASFFWFYADLSAPDPFFVMPILLGAAMFWQTRLMPTPSADPAQQKMMMIMPLMFAGFMIFLPVGLTLYILVNTLMTILQQWMYQRGIRLRDLLRGRGERKLLV